MKKAIPTFISLLLAVTFTACTSASSSNTETTTSAVLSETATTTEVQSEDGISETADTTATEITEVTETANTTLVVYFSWSGNSEEMAKTIAEQTVGDLFELVPVNAYPEDYTECTEVALVERDNNQRPAIQNLPETIDGYENIYICYPIWWHTAPMIVGTFLESYDLSGINIYPCTQSASMNEEQFDNSMEFIRECAGNGEVHDGLFANAFDTDAIREYIS